MPELPEVEGLTRFLRGACVGAGIERVQVASLSALKTAVPPLDDLTGRTIDAVERHGKFIAVTAGDLHLVFHLAKAGWLRWYPEVPTTPLKPGGGYIALRIRLDSGAGFDLTEAGKRKRLAVYLVSTPDDVPGIARLGRDPLAPGFDRGVFADLLAGSRTQLKGLLRDQSVLAGVGNAYSDEILHAARLSPFLVSGQLDEAAVDRLYTALVTVLTDALEAADGRPAAELKDAKRRTLRVHGRAGETCPECGDTIAEVSFADSSLQYCPTCQTGGRKLADRRTSRFLK